MRILKQSSTAQPLVFKMVLTSDHLSPSTGLTPTVTLSKNGGAFSAAAGTVTEIANGWYKVAGNATDTGTLGPLVLHATGTSSDASDVVFDVVAYDPQDGVHLGITALPNAAAAAANGLLTFGTGSGQLTATSGVIKSNLVQVDGLTTAGNAATLNLRAINLTNPSGRALSIFCANNSAVLIESDNGDAIQLHSEGLGFAGLNIFSAGSGIQFSGNISGNPDFTGSIASLVGAVALTGDYDAAKTAAQAATALSTVVWTNTIAGRIDAAVSSRSSLVTADVVNGILDALVSGHVTNGSVGAALQFARAFAAGKRVIDGDTMRLYDLDGTTLIATLNLQPAGGPYTAVSP